MSKRQNGCDREALTCSGPGRKIFCHSQSHREVSRALLYTVTQEPGLTVALPFPTLGFSKRPQLVPPVCRRGQRAWRPYRPGLEMAHRFFSLPLPSTWSHGHSGYKGVWEMCPGLESRKDGEQDFGGQPTVSALVGNNGSNQNRNI